MNVEQGPRMKQREHVAAYAHQTDTQVLAWFFSVSSYEPAGTHRTGIFVHIISD